MRARNFLAGYGPDFTGRAFHCLNSSELLPPVLTIYPKCESLLPM
jgi:hypothetical protein